MLSDMEEMMVNNDESEKDCTKTRKKKFNVGTVVMELQKGDTVPKGLVLKRELNIRECRHIMKNLLMIDINAEEDCFDSEEYKEFLTVERIFNKCSDCEINNI